MRTIKEIAQVVLEHYQETWSEHWLCPLLMLLHGAGFITLNEKNLFNDVIRDELCQAGLYDGRPVRQFLSEAWEIRGNLYNVLEVGGIKARINWLNAIVEGTVQYPLLEEAHEWETE